MKRAIAKLMCSLFHGGGHITRDSQNRINWQCAKCGRWSDSPVEHDEERRMAHEALKHYRQNPEREWQ